MRRLLEKVVIFALLLLVMGSFSSLFLGANLRENGLDVSNNGGSLAVDFVEILIYSGCAYFAFASYRRMFVSLGAAWPFLLMAAYALCSTAWSVDPGTTMRRACVLLATTVFGAYLGGRYSVEEFQQLLMQALLLMVGASLVCLVLRPSAVLDPSHAGNFRGLTEHKNIFGEYMGSLLFLGLTYRFQGKQLARASVILLALAMLAWAHSGTALLSIAATIITLPFLFLLRFRKVQAVPLTALGMALLSGIFVFASSLYVQVLDTLGKDPTLTGRTVIWSEVEKAILRRPWLGYGFDAFWQGLKGESRSVVSVVGWNVPHSHNGYLEALLGFGVVGSGLIAMMVLRMLYDSLAYVRFRRSAAGFWPCAFLFCFLIHAIAEAGFIKRDGLAYLLLVTLSTSLALERKVHAAKASLAQRQSDSQYDQQSDQQGWTVAFPFSQLPRSPLPHAVHSNEISHLSSRGV